jgi:hypothetical protein
MRNRRTVEWQVGGEDDGHEAGLSIWHDLPTPASNAPHATATAYARVQRPQPLGRLGRWGQSDTETGAAALPFGCCTAVWCLRLGSRVWESGMEDSEPRMRHHTGADTRTVVECSAAECIDSIESVVRWAESAQRMHHMGPTP